MCFMERETLTTAANETWRPVRDFEGLYEVSNLAQVRSLNHDTEYISKWGTPGIRSVKGQILKQHICGNCPYYRISLRKGGKIYTKMTHQLVAEAFVPNPHNLPEINHKDEDKTNNLPDNLEWCDRKYNVNYGTGKYRRAEKCQKYKKPIEQLTMEGERVAIYTSAKAAQRLSGGLYAAWNIRNVALSTSSHCQSVYGYRWRFIDKIDDRSLLVTEPFEPKGLKRNRTIEQLTLDGQHVAFYKSFPEAIMATGANRSSLCMVCKGKRKAAAGYRWRYV